MTHQAPDRLFLDFQAAIAGRYSLERELGRGGMGVVYLAREVRLDRPVAIKLLPPSKATDPKLRERFLREARTAAKLSHPNVIPIHAVEEIGGFVFFAMAYIEGETLTERVRRRGPLAPSEGSRVLRDVAWALAYAHGQGVIHRDVKPDNILIENNGRVLVADFGIASVVAGAGALATGEVVGTPEFMSPEQALGEAVDARTDPYSLGIVGYFTCSGALPFEADKATDVLAKQVTEPAAPLASVAPLVPRRLAQAIDRCLAKDPADRPDGPAALAEQLSHALEQRRELPVALRAFVKHDARLVGIRAVPALDQWCRPRRRRVCVGRFCRLGPTELSADDHVDVVPDGWGGVGHRRARDVAAPARCRRGILGAVVDRPRRPLAVWRRTHVHRNEGAARVAHPSSHGARAGHGGRAALRNAAERDAPAAARSTGCGAPPGAGRATHARPARGAAGSVVGCRSQRQSRSGDRGATRPHRCRSQRRARPGAAAPQRRRRGARDDPAESAPATCGHGERAEFDDRPGTGARTGARHRCARGRAARGGRRALVANALQPLDCLLQHLLRLTKRKPDVLATQLRTRVEARARHRRDAMLGGQPLGEFVVRQFRDV